MKCSRKLSSLKGTKTYSLKVDIMEELSEMIRKYLTYLDELMVSDEKDRTLGGCWDDYEECLENALKEVCMMILKGEL